MKRRKKKEVVQDVQDVDRWRVIVGATGENRYLWLNSGRWWASITLTNEEGTRAVRRRFSLKTVNVELARVRRDKIIAAINAHKGGIDLNMTSK